MRGRANATRQSRVNARPETRACANGLTHARGKARPRASASEPPARATSPTSPCAASSPRTRNFVAPIPARVTRSVQIMSGSMARLPSARRTSSSGTPSVDQGAENHVARRAGEAVEVQCCQPVHLTLLAAESPPIRQSSSSAGPPGSDDRGRRSPSLLRRSPSVT